MSSRAYTRMMLVLLLMVGLFVSACSSSDPEKELLAKCLGENGMVFYASYECSHCNTQKEMFGSGVKYLDYVECGPLGQAPAQECLDAGVTAYPTWVFEGQQLVGVQELSFLAEVADCEY